MNADHTLRSWTLPLTGEVNRQSSTKYSLLKSWSHADKKQLKKTEIPAQAPTNLDFVKETFKGKMLNVGEKLEK